MILAHNQHHKPFLGLDNNNNYKNFLLHKSEMHSIPLISNKEDYRLKKVSILNTLNTLYKITLWNKFLKFAKPFSIHFFSVLAIYSVSEKNEAIFSSWLTFYTHLKLNTFDTSYKITASNKFLQIAKPFSIHLF